MYKDGADLPDDLVNKVLGLNAFYKASSTNAKKIEMDPLNASLSLILVYAILIKSRKHLFWLGGWVCEHVHACA